jgi:predicted DNA-binding protein
MKSSRKKATPARKNNRASISFPAEVYSELEKLAMAKKVSLAWIVREATEKYLADQWPLLAERK